jgi:hypothetical protein
VGGLLILAIRRFPAPIVVGTGGENMKHLVGVALMVVGAGWQTMARAEVSEDLKFCAALKSSKERLGCYDAAMRLAKPAPVVLVEPPRPNTAYLPPALKKSRFGGLYAGVTGGYEFANSNPYISYAKPAGPIVGTPIGTPFVPIDSLKGAKVGGLFGYNAAAGDLLFGFEGRAQYSFSKSHQADLYIYPDLTFPRTLQTCFPSCGNPDLSGFGPIGISASIEQTVARNHQWQVDFSTRTGIIFGDSLIYAKTGVGAEDSFFRSTYRFSQTLCDPVLVIQKLKPQFRLCSRNRLQEHHQYSRHNHQY